MLINFFSTLKKAKVPVSIKELLDLLAAMEQNLAFGSVDDFYLLARTCMVKDEKYYDRFDRAFGAYFKNLENIDGIVEALLPEDWLRKEFEKHFTEEEKAKVENDNFINDEYSNDNYDDLISDSLTEDEA